MITESIRFEFRTRPELAGIRRLEFLPLRARLAGYASLLARLLSHLFGQGAIDPLDEIILLFAVFGP